MKLKIILSCLVLLLLSPVFAAENRIPVADNLYLDANSIDKYDTGKVTGDFIRTSENKRIKFRKVAYTKITTGAYCKSNSKQSDYPIYRYYDKNNKLLKEDNIYTDWQKDFPGGNPGVTLAEYVEFGELYFNTLCKY